MKREEFALPVYAKDISIIKNIAVTHVEDLHRMCFLSEKFALSIWIKYMERILYDEFLANLVLLNLEQTDEKKKENIKTLIQNMYHIIYMKEQDQKRNSIPDLKRENEIQKIRRFIESNSTEHYVLREVRQLWGDFDNKGKGTKNERLQERTSGKLSGYRRDPQDREGLRPGEVLQTGEELQTGRGLQTGEELQTGRGLQPGEEIQGREVIQNREALHNGLSVRGNTSYGDTDFRKESFSKGVRLFHKESAGKGFAVNDIAGQDFAAKDNGGQDFSEMLLRREKRKMWRESAASERREATDRIRREGHAEEKRNRAEHPGLQGIKRIVAVLGEAEREQENSRNRLTEWLRGKTTFAEGEGYDSAGQLVWRNPEKEISEQETGRLSGYRRSPQEREGLQDRKGLQAGEELQSGKGLQPGEVLHSRKELQPGEEIQGREVIQNREALHNGLSVRGNTSYGDTDFRKRSFSGKAEFSGKASVKREWEEGASQGADLSGKESEKGGFFGKVFSENGIAENGIAENGIAENGIAEAAIQGILMENRPVFLKEQNRMWKELFVSERKEATDGILREENKESKSFLSAFLGKGSGQEKGGTLLWERSGEKSTSVEKERTYRDRHLVWRISEKEFSEQGAGSLSGYRRSPQEREGLQVREELRAREVLQSRRKQQTREYPSDGDTDFRKRSFSGKAEFSGKASVKREWEEGASQGADLSGKESEKGGFFGKVFSENGIAENGIAENGIAEAAIQGILMENRPVFLKEQNRMWKELFVSERKEATDGILREENKESKSFLSAFLGKGIGQEKGGTLLWERSGEKSTSVEKERTYRDRHLVWRISEKEFSEQGAGSLSGYRRSPQEREGLQAREELRAREVLQSRRKQQTREYSPDGDTDFRKESFSEKARFSGKASAKRKWEEGAFQGADLSGKESEKGEFFGKGFSENGIAENGIAEAAIQGILLENRLVFLKEQNKMWRESAASERKEAADGIRREGHTKEKRNRAEHPGLHGIKRIVAVLGEAEREQENSRNRLAEWLRGKTTFAEGEGYGSARQLVWRNQEQESQKHFNGYLSGYQEMLQDRKSLQSRDAVRKYREHAFAGDVNLKRTGAFQSMILPEKERVLKERYRIWKASSVSGRTGDSREKGGNRLWGWQTGEVLQNQDTEKSLPFVYKVTNIYDYFSENLPADVYKEDEPVFIKKEQPAKTVFYRVRDTEKQIVKENRILRQSVEKLQETIEDSYEREIESTRTMEELTEQIEVQEKEIEKLQNENQELQKALISEKREEERIKKVADLFDNSFQLERLRHGG